MHNCTRNCILKGSRIALMEITLKGTQSHRQWRYSIGHNITSYYWSVVTKFYASILGRFGYIAIFIEHVCALGSFHSRLRQFTLHATCDFILVFGCNSAVSKLLTLVYANQNGARDRGMKWVARVVTKANGPTVGVMPAYRVRSVRLSRHLNEARYWQDQQHVAG